MTGPSVIRNLCLTDPRFLPFRKQLELYQDRYPAMLPSIFWEHVKVQKTTAVGDGDQLAAKAFWCIETIGRAQDRFTAGFLAAKNDDFYTFWCDLERVEVALHALERHYPSDAGDFGLLHLRVHVPRFQELFPYRQFFSPGMIVRRFECSVCHEQMKLRGGCNHFVGEIYDGEMCHRILDDIQVREVSIVDIPVQKYSVLFGPDIAYEYGPVRYVVLGLSSLWNAWQCQIKDIEEAPERFPGTDPSSNCPCDSGKPYHECCQDKPRIRRHHEVLFHVDPPPTLPAETHD